MDVNAGLALIKNHMPLTYRAIRERAASANGGGTFALVRRALAGEPSCFYAVEAGHVVGAPFAQADMPPDLATLMVGFGCGHLVMWPLPAASLSEQGGAL